MKLLMFKKGRPNLRKHYRISTMTLKKTRAAIFFFLHMCAKLKSRRRKHQQCIHRDWNMQRGMGVSSIVTLLNVVFSIILLNKMFKSLGFSNIFCDTFHTDFGGMIHFIFLWKFGLEIYARPKASSPYMMFIKLLWNTNEKFDRI